MVRKFIIGLPLVMLWAIALAQETNTINGIVRDSETNYPLEMVQVLLVDSQEHKLLGRAISGLDGSYSISHSSLADRSSIAHLKLRFTLLGYQQKEISLLDVKEDTPIEVSLIQSEFTLKEVKVKAEPMSRSGDTLTYHAHAFTHKADTKLEEVLARMPDVEVMNTGTIKYQGKPINKFYIEELDLLAGRYNIATRNIHPEDVASVQIFENHEPIKIERKSSTSTTAAMNVRLKESAKSRWLINGEGAIGGYPIIGNISATAMNFKKGRQTIILAKADNTGDDIIYETKVQNVGMGVVFNPYTLSSGPQNLFSPRLLYSSFYGRDRRRDNRTALGSVNNLWLLDNKATLRFNLNYSYDDNRLKEEQRSEYFDPLLGTVALSEVTNYRVRHHATENEITYKQNQENFYLKDILKYDYHHLNTHDDLLVNDKERLVQMSLPQMALSNSVTLKKPLWNHIFTIGHILSYNQRPQKLRIGQEDEYNLSSRNWNGGLSIETLFPLGVHSIQPSLDFNIEEYRLKSFGGSGDVTPFSHQSLATKATAKIQYKYNRDNFRFIISPNLRWNYIKSGDLTHQNVLPNASLYAQYLNPLGKSSLSYSFLQSIPSIDQLFPYAIRKNYTVRTTGIKELSKTTFHAITFRHEGFLSVMDISYQLESTLSDIRMPRIRALQVMDGYLVYEYQPQAHHNSSWNNTLSGSKFFSSMYMTVTGKIGYQYSKGETLQQSQLLPYHMDVLTGHIGLSWTGSSFVSLDYSVQGNASCVKAKDIKTVSQMRGLEQNFKSTILLSDAWGVTTNLQHYYDKSKGRKPLNFLFVDAGIYYNHGKYRVQIDFTNLTNIREQRFVWQNGINRGFKSTQLRGREVLITLKIKK